MKAEDRGRPVSFRELCPGDFCITRLPMKCVPLGARSAPLVVVARGGRRLSVLCLRVAVTWGLQGGGLGVPAETRWTKGDRQHSDCVPSPWLRCLSPALSWLTAAGGRLLQVGLCAPSCYRNEWPASSPLLAPFFSPPRSSSSTLFTLSCLIIYPCG